MHNTLDTYEYFGNIDFGPTYLEECKNLIHTEETLPAERHAEGPYKDYHPIQVGYRKRNIEKFPVTGIDTDNSMFQIIHQQPGRMLPWHIDTFSDFIETGGYKSARTYLCFLADWVPGQTFGTKHDTYTHWKAGDTITWGYLVWHFSSNSSCIPKYTIQIVEGIK